MRVRPRNGRVRARNLALAGRQIQRAGITVLFNEIMVAVHGITLTK
ncbi:MAG: hypothetical protein ABSA59_16310 [Terriglobia bacterium]|jgi:hypothetical protein